MINSNIKVIGTSFLILILGLSSLPYAHSSTKNVSSQEVKKLSLLNKYNENTKLLINSKQPISIKLKTDMTNGGVEELYQRDVYGNILFKKYNVSTKEILAEEIFSENILYSYNDYGKNFLSTLKKEKIISIGKYYIKSIKLFEGNLPPGYTQNLLERKGEVAIVVDPIKSIEESREKYTEYVPSGPLQLIYQSKDLKYKEVIDFIVTRNQITNYKVKIFENQAEVGSIEVNISNFSQNIIKPKKSIDISKVITSRSFKNLKS